MTSSSVYWIVGSLGVLVVLIAAYRIRIDLKDKGDRDE